MSIHAIDGGGSSSSMGTPGEHRRTPGDALPSITVPPCDGTNTSAAQQLIHAQQELFHPRAREALPIPAMRPHVSTRTKDRRMTTPELFAIVPVEGKSPADAVATGPWSEVATYIGQSIPRIEEEQRLAQARADAAETAQHQAEMRAHALQMFTDGITRLGERLDAFIASRQARADQQQRDAEAAEIARVEAMINTLPDPDLPAVTSSALAAPGDDGDLKATKPPPDTEKYDPEDGDPDPDDPDTRAEAVIGTLPEKPAIGAP